MEISNSLKYIPVSDKEKQQALEELNLKSIDDLFRSIPKNLLKQTSASLSKPMSELEIRNRFKSDSSCAEIHCSFMGGNGHNHYIPSIIDPLTSRGEFLTAYTPYQPEVSQGTLQAMYEFQSMMADLMGVEVSNASLYDGSTAMLEAAFMSIRISRKNRVLFSDSIHPEYLETMNTYRDTDVFEFEMLPTGEDGKVSLPDLKRLLNEDTASVVIQSPNYSGIIEEIDSIKKEAGPNIMVIVVVTEAQSLALLRSPGSLGADIVCGEAQSFGIPLSYGGPWLGFIGSSMKNVRNMPGRLVGESVDSEGRRSFVVTLAAREQHIRREKATSNICTNQGLMALRATIYLSTMGKAGLRRASERSARFAAYGKKLLMGSSVRLRYPDSPFFNEFIIELPENAQTVFRKCVKSSGIAPGTIAGGNQ
ncbi:MAG: aminomethyl-transferring glycine dehydrogenase subunit GcvPA, partial [Spirochaetia bacterium]|nr:aminomethyl-transferring glycine dehydrogenase subunit GcvPA [Spirochaetia bacterium]